MAVKKGYHHGSSEVDALTGKRQSHAGEKPLFARAFLSLSACHSVRGHALEEAFPSRLILPGNTHLYS